MGIWNEKLYGSDSACDLRNMLKTLLKLPRSGEQLLTILLSRPDYQIIANDLNDIEGTEFWLVVADQFEHKGIVCQTVWDKALQIIKSGRDIANRKREGFNDRALNKRQQQLDALFANLQSPRPTKSRSTAKLPKMPVAAGKYIFFLP